MDEILYREKNLNSKNTRYFVTFYLSLTNRFLLISLKFGIIHSVKEHESRLSLYKFFFWKNIRGVWRGVKWFWRTVFF